MPPKPPAIPLARWASRKLEDLARVTGSANIAALDGQTLLGERASARNWQISGPVSAGLGGSRLMKAQDGNWLALTLIRDEDCDLVPALFNDPDIDGWDPPAIASAVARHDCAPLLAQGRELGMLIASTEETPASPAVTALTHGPGRLHDTKKQPLVIDLSAIWAGPLAGHLLWLAGAKVIKVESKTRPDLIRRDDPATFDLINQGKDNIAVDLRNADDRAALITLIHQADFVIESSRVRALYQLGIDANALVREAPGLVWLSITGHGASGEQANWAGTGNDCGVAGGLTRAMAEVSGRIGYVGDAITDPLTGIIAALEGWKAYVAGKAIRTGFAMSAIAQTALAQERAHDRQKIDAELCAWGLGEGAPFPKVKRRPLMAGVHEHGADNDRWLGKAIGQC